MNIVGYITSLLIGLLLGIIGGGGSILTVPMLVYMFLLDATVATSYSLLIVGTTSAIGAITYYKQQLIDVKTAFMFGIPSMVAVLITRKFIVPLVPASLHFYYTTISKGTLLLVLFAFLMLASAYQLIMKPAANYQAQSTVRIAFVTLLSQGLAVGFVTGFVGAGGGFLIIPALTLVAKLPIKTAIGTSLLIISANTLVGFIGFSLTASIPPAHWMMLLTISAFAIIGMLVGSTIAKKISPTKLKPAFGWFIFFVAVYMLVKETIL
jgi:uncharacterized protein